MFYQIVQNTEGHMAGPVSQPISNYTGQTQDINLCFTLYAACPLNRARPWSEVNIISVYFVNVAGLLYMDKSWSEVNII
jgi:hypothetical protein